MAAIPAKLRVRLIKVLGMLGSTHDGERANAAAAATKLLMELRLTWDELLSDDAPYPPSETREQHSYRAALAEARRAGYEAGYEAGYQAGHRRAQQDADAASSTHQDWAPFHNWRDAHAAAVTHGHYLSDWERSFVTNLFKYRKLTTKQADKLHQVLDKLRAARVI